MAELKVSILVPKTDKNWGFSPPNFYGARMNPLIEDRLPVFQNIPRRVTDFRENRLRDVEKSLDGKKKL